MILYKEDLIQSRVTNFISHLPHSHKTLLYSGKGRSLVLLALPLNSKSYYLPEYNAVDMIINTPCVTSPVVSHLYWGAKL